MKKYGKRIAAFALAMVVALGSVCYKPPKAEAAIIEGMLANMFLSTYMTATGISLVPDEKTAERLADALDSLVPDFVTDYAAEVGEFTVDTFNSIIEQNCVIQTTGLLQIGHQAAALMGRFTGWLISTYGLMDGNDEPVSYPAFLLPKSIALPHWGECLEKMGEYYDKWPYHLVTYLPSSGNFKYYCSSAPFYYDEVDDTKNGWRSPGQFDYCSWSPSKEIWTSYLNEGSLSNRFALYTTDKSIPVAANHQIINMVEDDSYEDVKCSTIALSPNYQSAPTVDEQYSMVIDTGLTFEDEQGFIDSILGATAAGTISPSYTIVVTPTVEEDKEDETAGIL